MCSERDINALERKCGERMLEFDWFRRGFSLLAHSWIILTSLSLMFSKDVFVKIFAKVPYLQHYYDTGCLDKES